MNNETYTKTQFNEIKQQLSSYAISSFGKKLIEATQPHSKLSVVKKRLTETTEAKNLLDSNLHVPFMGLQSIEHITNQLEKGFVLTPQELLEYAAIAEVNSNHPIAKSILSYYNKKIDLDTIDSYE